MRVGIIGSGMIAKKITKLISKHDFKVTAIYSRNEKTRKKLAKKVKAKEFNTIDDFINNKDLYDFVYIATPHSTHFEYASICLKNYIPVLVEKPIAINEKEILELIKLNEKYDTYIAEAMWTWFGSPLLTLDNAIKEKKFGDILEARFDFEILKPHFHKFDRLFDPNRAGGALMDLGIYLVTSSYKLFGEPLDIEVNSKIIKNIDVIDEIIFKYESFNLTMKTGFYKFKDQMFIKFSDGYIKLPSGHKPNKIVVHKKGKNYKFKGETSYLNEFVKVREEINSGSKVSSFISLEDNLHILRLMDKIRDKIHLQFPFEN